MTQATNQPAQRPADAGRTPLTPLAFLGRSAEVFGDKVAIVHGDRRATYREFAAEATRLASALRTSGVEPGDRVAYLCPNIPELLVAHFGVPLAGAVLVAINTRLAPDEVRYILDHSGARLVVADTALHPTLEPVAASLRTVREVVAVDDTGTPPTVGGPSYAELLARASGRPAGRARSARRGRGCWRARAWPW